ncbi:MAG: phage holin, LLH family [Candidatus Subteraquimicrobiales bacterium]|nr:phage holin, LLH family [Candidatus Subteraquimicrobiales bacterium]
MKKVLCLLLTLIFISVSATGFAADAAAQVSQPTVGEAIKDVINNTIIPLIVALIGSLLSIVLVKLKNKYNIQLSAENEEWIKKQAESAVQAVAEKAAAKLKYEKVNPAKNEKLNMAIAYLISKVPKLTKEQADAYIHAAIARIPGVGATGEQSLVPAGK